MRDDGGRSSRLLQAGALPSTARRMRIARSVFQRLAVPGFSISTRSVPGIRDWSGQRPIADDGRHAGVRARPWPAHRSSAGVDAEVVQAAQDVVVPVPRIREQREPVIRDLARLV